MEPDTNVSPPLKQKGVQTLVLFGKLPASKLIFGPLPLGKAEARNNPTPGPKILSSNVISRFPSLIAAVLLPVVYEFASGPEIVMSQETKFKSELTVNEPEIVSVPNMPSVNVAVTSQIVSAFACVEQTNPTPTATSNAKRFFKSVPLEKYTCTHCYWALVY